MIPLSSADVILDYGDLGNFRYKVCAETSETMSVQNLKVSSYIDSVAGFEMILRRHISHYLITYYLPSGQTLFICHTYQCI